MKEIVKDGKIEHKETYPLFICPKCGCEFYGTEMPRDYWESLYFDEDDFGTYRIHRFKYVSTCPCCENSKVEHDGNKFYTKVTYIEGEEKIKEYLKSLEEKLKSASFLNI